MSESHASREMSRREAIVKGWGAIIVITSSGCQMITGVNPAIEMGRAFWNGYQNREENRAPLSPEPINPASPANHLPAIEISGRIPNSNWILNPDHRSVIYDKHAEDYKKEYMMFVIEGVTRVLAAGFRVPPRVMTAQSPLENTYGTDPVATQAKNYFGIKGAGFWTPTHEDYGSGLEPIVDSFRTYSGKFDSFYDYATMVTTLDHYINIVNCATDYDALLELQNDTNQSCGLVRAQGPGVLSYATVDDYEDRVMNVIDSWRLQEVFIEA